MVVTTEKQKKYSAAEIKKRWQKKKEQVQHLANTISRLRNNITRDLKSADEKVKLTALVLAVMDKTAERVGNSLSEQDGHFGVTGFCKKHIVINGNTVQLQYTGKSGVEHDKQFSDAEIAAALKEAIKNSPCNFIFCTTDGFRIKAEKINRYLDAFDISAKDLRGYSANKIMVTKLNNIETIEAEEPKRKKQFLKVLRETAKKVGHGASTLRNQYLMPELEIKFIEHGKVLDLADFYKKGGEVQKMEMGGLFHGSPHEFDKFSTSNMGGGEGAQAIGWGLYFTDLQDIAKHYALTPSEESFFINGVSLKNSKLTKDEKETILGLWQHTYTSGNQETKAEFIGEIIYQLQITSALLDDEAQRMFDEKELEEINNSIAVNKKLFDLLSNADVDIKGNVYNLTLHKGKQTNEYDWLLWDKPVPESQAKKILAKAKEEKRFFDVETEKNLKWFDIHLQTGSMMYSWIKQQYAKGYHYVPEWAAKEASLFLLSIGIDGIKYPANFLYSDESTDTAKNFNYVIFDENAISIEGKQKFAKGGNIKTLLAPNGKPTNLSPEQYKLVRTPEFKAWFGDFEKEPEKASKVVDENGEPLVMWHGSYNKINKFSERKSYRGFYFSNHKGTAEPYDNGKESSIFKKVYKYGVFLSIKKPKNVFSYRDIQHLDEFQIRDYKIFFKDVDGIIWQPDKEEAVAFYSTQIKLADGSNIKFNSTNSDIRFKDGGNITLRASNGKPTNLSPEQYKLVRTHEFRAFFGDWLNKGFFEAINKTIPSVNLPENIIRPSDREEERDIVKRLERKTVNIASSNKSIYISKTSYKKTLIHAGRDEVFLSIFSIGKILEQALFFDIEPNFDEKDTSTDFFESYFSTCSYRSENYLVRITVQVGHDKKRTLHDWNVEKKALLTSAVSGKLPNRTNLVRSAFESKDRKISLLLQTIPKNISKVVDENGEPLVVYHGTNTDFNVFDNDYIASNRGNHGHYGYGFYFSEDIREAKGYGNRILTAFCNMKNPFVSKEELFPLLKENGIYWIDDTVPLSIDFESLYAEVKKIDDISAELLRLTHENGGREKGWELFLEKYNTETAKLNLNDVSDLYYYVENENGILDERYFKELGIDYNNLKFKNGYLYGQSLHWVTQLGERSKEVTDVIKKLGYDGVIAAGEYVFFEPAQIKLADGSNTKFNTHNPDIRFEEGGYLHGSKFNFCDTGFTLNKIGEGQGQNIWGAGIYLTQDKPLATYYAKYVVDDKEEKQLQQQVADMLGFKTFDDIPHDYNNEKIKVESTSKYLRYGLYDQLLKQHIEKKKQDGIVYDTTLFKGKKKSEYKILHMVGTPKKEWDDAKKEILNIYNTLLKNRSKYKEAIKKMVNRISPFKFIEKEFDERYDDILESTNDKYEKFHFYHSDYTKGINNALYNLDFKRIFDDVLWKQTDYYKNYFKKLSDAETQKYISAYFREGEKLLTTFFQDAGYDAVVYSREFDITPLKDETEHYARAIVVFNPNDITIEQCLKPTGKKLVPIMDNTPEVSNLAQQAADIVELLDVLDGTEKKKMVQELHDVISLIEIDKPNVANYMRSRYSKELSVKRFADGGTVETINITDTPEFKAWFNGSKVVGENGQPLVVHRGHSGEHLGYEFKLGYNLLNKPHKNNFGYFFSTDVRLAERYSGDAYDIDGGHLFSVYLKINKLLDIRAIGDKAYYGKDIINALENEGVSFFEHRELKDAILSYEAQRGYRYDVWDYFDVFPLLREVIISSGFDGLVFMDNSASWLTTSYVVFHSNQIKLADGSNTTFDGSTPDIRFLKGGAVEAPQKIAPNGKRSNLYQSGIGKNGEWVYVYDIVRTPEFKAWFGDWEEAYKTKDYEGVSRIIDDNGEPMVCYHNTNNEFNEFDKSHIGSTTDGGFYGEGFYFSDVAQDRYGERELKCFLNIKNPYLKQSSYRTYELNTESLKSEGYDGVIVYGSWIEAFNLENGLDRVEEIVAYHPEQIKLADGSNTEFDKYNSDIRFKDGGEISVLNNKTIKIEWQNNIFNIGFQRGQRGDSDKKVWFATIVNVNNTDLRELNSEGFLCYGSGLEYQLFDFSLYDLQKTIIGHAKTNDLWLVINDDKGVNKNIYHPLFNTGNIKFDEGGTVENLSNYQKRITANMEFMNTKFKEWRATPISGFSKTTNHKGNEVSMPLFDFPKEYSHAVSLFHCPSNQEPANCELCGKVPIRTIYWIQNDEQKLTLAVGSECVKYVGAGTTGKENLRAAKLELAKILDNDIGVLADAIAKRWRRKRSIGYGRTEIEWGSSYIGEESADDFSNMANNVREIHKLNIDSLFEKKKYPVKHSHILWGYVWKALPYFGYADSVLQMRRFNETQETVDKNLLTWFTRNEELASKMIEQSTAVLKILFDDFEFTSDYLAAKNNNDTDTKFFDGGEVTKTDEENRTIVWESGDYKISVSGLENPANRYLYLWAFDYDKTGKYIKAGQLILAFSNALSNKAANYAMVQIVSIDKKYQGRGFAKELYRQAMRFLPNNKQGIVAYYPQIVNPKKLKRLYLSLGGYEDKEDGNYYLEKKSINFFDLDSMVEEFKIKKSENKGEYFGNYRGIEWHISPMRDGKIVWYYITQGGTTLDQPTIGKESALKIVKDNIDYDLDRPDLSLLSSVNK